MKEIFSINTPLSSTLMISLFPCCCEQPESVHQTASNGKGLLLLLLFFPLTAVLGCCLKKKGTGQGSRNLNGLHSKHLTCPYFLWKPIL